MRPFNNNTHLPFSQRQIFTLLFVWFLVISILLTFESTSALQGASEMETDVLEDDQIVVPWKKLYRPRGPPRFGKRGLLVMNRQRNFPE
uniref:Uncharacterized protein n=2 Tax=Meloidogyne TaxID=189290 RepID=A0A6V7TVG3_MELEN|nr:unnamed protein product [Meloidogyne enterolobii]